jgi:hypothetical protein
LSTNTFASTRQVTATLTLFMKRGSLMKSLGLLFTGTLIVMIVSLAFTDVAIVDAARKPTKTPQPTNEAGPPTKEPTLVPPTSTAVPPTATNVPPTATAVPPTATNIPPSATSVPPTMTPTPKSSPTATPTASATPAAAYEGVPKCSKALHDKYVTVAPDGKAYPAWHPLIDQENSAPCSHQHEHGNNPHLLSPNWNPAFGYVAAKHGMSEPHAGFKVAVLPASAVGGKTGVVIHMGGAGSARFCQRFHSFQYAAVNASGALIVDVQFMGDYGKAVHNSSQTVLTPAECPSQGTVSSTGLRQIPGFVNGSLDSYEPWRVDLKGTKFGFVGDFTINSRSAAMVCQSIPNCVGVTVNLTENHHGTGTVRFFTGNKSSTDISFRLDESKAAAGWENTFCTDAMGRNLLACSDPGAVQQYVAPGTVAVYPCPNTNSNHCTITNVDELAIPGDSGDVNEPGGVPPGSPN